MTSDEKAIQLMQELVSICGLGGFKLTKWLSNSKTVLESVPEIERAKTVINLDMSKDSLPTDRTLGIFWNAEKDAFCFNIDILELESTRRGILSMVSRTYDPMGLVTPFVLPARVVLQELCRTCLDWDSTIPDIDRKQWQSWGQELQNLENLEIEICLNPNESTNAKHELYVFCDASENAYCAVGYLRVATEADVKCTLVMSKSRVTPINKRITIPRLELSSCKLGIEFEKEIDLELDTYYWTDSMSALRYISNDTPRFHTFVANRAHFITEGRDKNQWRHIKSELNPADIR